MLKYRIKEIARNIYCENTKRNKVVKLYQIQFSIFGFIWFDKHLDWWGDSACYLSKDEAEKCLKILKNN